MDEIELLREQVRVLEQRVKLLESRSQVMMRIPPVPPPIKSQMPKMVKDCYNCYHRKETTDFCNAHGCNEESDSLRRCPDFFNKHIYGN